jgi:erythromycin esterase
MYPSSAVIDWIRAAAIPLATAEPRSGCADLEPLRAVIGDARIVALGEATHGTREFFQLKHRLIEFCVAELGFTMLIMEANFAEALAVNDYVLHGIGTAADAVACLRWWPWDTQEVVDVVEWLRGWNAGHARKVKFYGYDIADPPAAALGLIDYLDRAAPALAADGRAELAPLVSDLTAALFARTSPDRRAEMLAGIGRLRDAFAQNRAAWSAATSVLDWHLGRLHATVLDQSVRFIAERTSPLHERAVAENVSALLEAEGPDARAIIWAHNDHVARASSPDGDDPLGTHLDAMFGRAQVVIGFAFDRGAFQARDFPFGALVDHRVTAAPPETFEAALAQAGLPLFCLDLAHALGEGPVAAWLASEMPMRSIGGIFGLPQGNEYGVSYTRTIMPRCCFDAVVFVAETTAARRNHERSAAAAPALEAPANLELAGEGVPTGWRFVGAEHGCASGVRHERAPSGARALRLSRAAGAPRWGDIRLLQKISARPWRGRRVSFAAALRTEVDRGGGALLLLQFMAGGTGAQLYAREIALVASAEQPEPLPQWRRTVVAAGVPEEADALVIGLVMTGTGAAWFGDLELTSI